MSPLRLDAETRLRLLERSADVVLRYCLHPTPCFEYVSPSIIALLGHTPEDCYANPELLAALVHPDDLAPLRDLQAPEPAQVRWLARDGTTRWTLTRREPVLDDGRVTGVDLVIRDISAQRALEAERNFSSRLVDTAHAIVLVLDNDGKISFFNRYMAELSGYSLDEVRGQDWFERFIPHHDAPRVRTVFASALDDVEVLGNINPIRTKSGEERQIEWYGKTLHDGDGTTFGLLSVGWDVTEKLALLAKLQQNERLATIGMMASIFAHEVGNPLNSMYLQAQLLKRRIDNPRPDQPLGPRVDGIMNEILRLNGLLEEFRSFHRPEQIVLEDTDLTHVLHEIVDNLILPVAQPEIRVHHEIAKLPRIRGNADKLKQVFLNLCKNALEAMPEGGSLELHAQVSSERIVVEIRDTGTGIPEDIDVFEPFRTTKPEGTGLGLPLVREIVRAHGGEVRYSSTIGQGTTFVVELPLAHAS